MIILKHLTDYHLCFFGVFLCKKIGISNIEFKDNLGQKKINDSVVKTKT